MENETQKVSDLKKHSRNPRRISKTDFENLKMSIKKYGDLSGIVKNETTGELVGGNQRTEAFKAIGNPPIVITETLPEPNSVGTVARGYVVLGDEKYTYRVVRWDAQTELQANVAANRIQGEWDTELLAEITAELEAVGHDVALATGQTDDEIKALLNSVGALGDTPTERSNNALSFDLDAQQLLVVNDALFKCRQLNNLNGDTTGAGKAEALYLIARDYLDAIGEAPTSGPAAQNEPPKLDDIRVA